MRPVTGAVTLLALAALALAGCSSSSGGGDTAPTPGPSRPAPSPTVPRSLGAGEGGLDLLARSGYAENGSNDRAVDWVTPFTEATGCQVRVKIPASSDEMLALMKTGRYDGVSATGEVTGRLIAGGEVAPVNTALVPNYATVSGFLKNRSWNSVGRQMYGVPHGWGADLLMSRSDILVPAPTSWGVVFDPESPYRGRITAYDSPISIAAAALYLRTARPDLSITDPYELDDAQFAAAVDLLQQQRGAIGKYWADYTQEIKAFESGDSVVGPGWQVIANLIDAGGRAKVNAVVPKEGSTGWSDTWMVSTRARHPNCMYRWMDWILSPTVNAQAAEWFGQAPAQTRACAETSDRNFCAAFHATDKAYASRIRFRATPAHDCADGRGAVCKDWAAWARAWSEIKG
jgi:putative spermidine/putrescine transport system substrate-binding protein